MMCTHCQYSTEWRPTAQDSRGHLGQPINEFVMNSFAYVQQVSQLWRENSKKLNYGTNIEINERRCTSWQNHLKMWSIYWVMSFKALDTAERLWRLLLDYTMHKRRILSGSKWSVWRGLTLKQFLGKWTYGQTLDTFPLKNKSFSTKLFS